MPHDRLAKKMYRSEVEGKSERKTVSILGEEMVDNIWERTQEGTREIKQAREACLCWAARKISTWPPLPSSSGWGFSETSKTLLIFSLDGPSPQKKNLNCTQ